MKFQVKTEDVAGTHETVVDGVDKFAVYRDLKKKGENVLTVVEISEGKKSSSFDFGRVTIHDKILFAKNTAAMLKAGLTLSRILSVMERQAKKKKLKAVFAEINDGIRSGKNFSSVIAGQTKYFSITFVSMIRAGEESGNLADAMSILGEQMEQTNLLVKKIRGAMLYPAIVLSIMAIVGVLLMIYVVPTLTSTFEELGVVLPISTRIIIGISNILKYHIFIFLLSVASVVGIIFYSSKTSRGKKAIDWILLKIPIVGVLIKESTAARVSRTLSSLLSSGVDFVVAIGITEDVVSNSYHKAVLKEAKEKVEKGSPISEVFIQNEDLFPAYMGEMMNVGEETGKISEMLLGVAKYYEAEVTQKTKDMSTIIEPVLMVIIGVGVGFFAISMISPMYEVLNNV